MTKVSDLPVLQVLGLAVKGLTNAQCLRVRELASHVADGPDRGWWASADEALEAFPKRRLKMLQASSNWDAIFQAIQQLIEAISAGK